MARFTIIASEHGKPIVKSFAESPKEAKMKFDRRYSEKYGDGNYARKNKNR